MARRDKPPGRTGPVKRMPWSNGAYPGDCRPTRGNRMHRTPRPGGRTGPVRSARR